MNHKFNIIFAGCLLVLTILMCNVNCTKDSKLTTGGDRLFFPCPENCTKYYRLVHGRLLKLTCPSGLHWNDALDICDWPEEANCVEVPLESVKQIVIPKPEPSLAIQDAKKVVCYCKYPTIHN